MSPKKEIFFKIIGPKKKENPALPISHPFPFANPTCREERERDRETERQRERDSTTQSAAPSSTGADDYERGLSVRVLLQMPPIFMHIVNLQSMFAVRCLICLVDLVINLQSMFASVLFSTILRPVLILVENFRSIG